MSETCGVISTQAPTAFDLRSVGFELPGSEVKIDNPDAKGVGEILIKGRNVMVGYFKNDIESRKTIDD